ncbi:MAG TPA: formylglycine-generating enzyme family protein [Novimethylophilus sp.]|jgi:iron(II)-dependent oxidoreductase|uniref:formylglycine-generating enzyme family protein n=1 Tax=Novimethylophilus sp. TaxID=2137426 RepID=UPI002F41745C
MRTFFLAAMLAAISVFSTAGVADTAGAPRQPDLPREIIINGVEFVLVPEGWFWYAVENGEREKAVQKGKPWFRDVKVWLDSYYIAKYEARARDLKRFLDSRDVKHRTEYGSGETKGCAVRRNEAGEYYLTEPERDLPATHLSWNLADEFTRWMGFRMPTEAEWVKAARGTDRRLWPWGDEYPDDTYAGFRAFGGCTPAPVTSFSNGKSPYGAYNMAGNVFEYVADWYNEQFDLDIKDGDRNPVPAATGTLTEGIPRPVKILKGGRWASSASFIHVYARTTMRPDENFRCFGVRFAVDVETARTHLENGTATIVEP